MSDAHRLPPRPDLEQYRKLAKDFQRACRSTEPGAFRACALRWLEILALATSGEVTIDARARIEREAHRIEHRWRKLQKEERRTRCLLADAQLFVAREHGFASWPKFVRHLEQLHERDSPVANYEVAVDAIVSGDIATLSRLLRAHPELARARSTREHRSTLLHYVSANGVEDYRQKTPPNIVEITRLLLEAGADVDATSEAYGGGSTTLGLAATSIHPEQAGVQIALMDVLLQHGASLEQPGYPLVKGCLANGQGGAARYLASRGAALDFEEAAGVGRLDLVTRYFNAQRSLATGLTAAQLQSGFLYACGYGQTQVAAFLLDKGVDPNVANAERQTALHWDAYGPHVEIARLLLQHGANVNVRDAAGRTPLDWAEEGRASATDADDVRRAREFVELLRHAGAVRG
jgi:ankyrin repeat protein